MQTKSHYAPIVALLLIAAVSGVALADSIGEKSFELQSISTQLKTNPNDVSLSLHLADLAIETGDYQTAIAPMEKLMVLYPDDAQLKLKLGILYYMVGSYDLAKSYLEQLIGSPSNPPQLAHQAQTYRARM